MKYHNLIKSQKGQSTVEAAVLAMFLVSFMVSFFVALYLIYSSYWVEHIMYESLICYQERGQKEFCADQAKEKIHSILVFNRSFDIKIEKHGSITRSKIQMIINPPIIGKKTFSFSKELRI